MSSFSELIKNFEKTRDYVRDFFIYGFKVRNDFNLKSSRTYDDEKRRVESWLGDCLRYDDSVRGRSISISVDSGHISENPLYKAYYSKSFTDNDIKLHFLLIDIFYGKEPMTLKQAVALLDESFGELFDEQTVRNKLKEYAEEGIFLTKKKGKTLYYKLSPDTAETLSEGIDGFWDAVKFYSEADRFGIVGNSIIKAENLVNDLFFMKHNYIVHTLADEILLIAVKAMEEKRELVLSSFSCKKRLNGQKNRGESISRIIPMQILSSVQTGRRYLMGYLPDYKRFNAYRADTVKKAVIGDKAADFDAVFEKYLKNKNRCFGVSFGNRSETGNVTPLKITFNIDEDKEGFVIDRLIREKRNGTVERLDKNTYLLTEDVFDPNEVMHWIKTFIGRIVKVEGGNEAVRLQFRNDIIKMHRMYSKNPLGKEKTV